MKFFVLALIAAFAITSCSKEENSTIDFQSFPQKWELVKIDGSDSLQLNGDNWQETYLLNADSSFEKIRILDQDTAMGSGTFQIVQSENENYLLLNFDSVTDEDIVSSCLRNKEDFIYQPNNRFVGTWNECDGPKLEYQRVY